MGLTVSGGMFKGQKLKVLPNSKILRPTSGKVREALFSILGTRINQCRFLDLFSGTGAVGIEAVSRGANFGLLVEKNDKVFNLLKVNCRIIKHAGLTPLKSDAYTILEGGAFVGPAFDIVFVDPPFYSDYNGLPDKVLGLTSNPGCAVIQYPVKRPPEWIAQVDKLKKYGESGLAFFYN
jgi:16S rRNA (guanine966-N2)-methyltransferase